MTENEPGIPPDEKRPSTSISLQTYSFGPDNEFHASKYFLQRFGAMPSYYAAQVEVVGKTTVEKILGHFELPAEALLFREEFSKKDKPLVPDPDYFYYVMVLQEGLVMVCFPGRIAFYYDKSRDLWPTIEDTLKHLVLKRKGRTPRTGKPFHMVVENVKARYGIALQEFNVKPIRVNLGQHYNDDLPETDKIIRKFINHTEQNGLVLLHGKVGTGKTTYIRHLISSTKAKFIYLPASMMKTISAPNFLPFIALHEDSVLLLEDSDELLAPRGSAQSGGSALANLLNLGDGLLADALKIKVICTFNAKLDKIDQAVLRKGRLVARYEFGPLALEKAKALSQSLGNQAEVVSEMTLAEIFNQDDKDYGKDPHGKRVGYF